MKSIFDKVYDIRSIHSIRELLDSSATLYYYNTAFMRRVNEKVENIPYHRLHEDTKALATYLNGIGLENKKIAVINTSRNAEPHHDYFVEIVYFYKGSVLKEKKYE